MWIALLAIFLCDDVFDLVGRVEAKTGSLPQSISTEWGMNPILHGSAGKGNCWFRWCVLFVVFYVRGEVAVDTTPPG